MTLAKWKSVGIALLAASCSIGLASALAIQDPPRRDSRKPAPKQPPAPAANPDPDSDPVALSVPRYLEARAGSGTALMYALDDKGERIPEKPAKPAAKVADNSGTWKEAEVPLRWVVVTGVVDNLGVREALIQAGKVQAADAFAKYKRVDVQRQVRRRGGDWSDWTLVNPEKNYEVLDNLPELSTEQTPEEYRPPALVDPLPVLKKGTWVGVDHERILRLPKPEPDKVLTELGRLPQSPLLAVRSIDFTVEPGTSYRYRARIVLDNPNRAKDGENVVFSPWSEPAKEVAVPLK